MSQTSLIQVEQERGEIASPSQPLNMQHLFEIIVSSSEDKADSLAKLQEIYFREQDRKSSLEFNQSLARFRHECPAVPRTTHVSYVTKTGGKVDYRSADFEQIMDTALPHLYANGFSVTFDMDTHDGMVTSTCTLRHVNGHSITSKATIPWASSNPGMTDQQKFGSANTFAKRTALTSVLGLNLTDPEEEGADNTPITAAQVELLKALIRETGTEIASFMNWATGNPQDDLSLIRATRFSEAVKLLERKRAK